MLASITGLAHSFKVHALLGPMCLSHFFHKYPTLPLPSSPLFSLSQFSFVYMAILNMEEEVGFQGEVPENHQEFTATEIQELLSLFLVNDGPPSSGSDSQGSIPTSAACSTNDDERKLRRMISNRESARRSRCRKKRHLEDLTNEVNRLMIQNRELKDQLGRILSRRHMVLRENDWLWMESVGLRVRLSDLCRIFAVMQ
ncbi:basic leucine zipper 4-like isoform X1 [Cucurbita moschata]|uniref:Basic leucine zipper 4-like isoform X1 n=2 Tax=Cucurbita moschata TaxID=3662 RepID=A0A6J1HH99_CUCMO|nr:basic leucine zipper 4-like isoform X1 [Cucurbita moschata]XP_022962505.1 basic leucine zipper 4-like isoform X1 [Cucurbita moschata]XP_022962506.1 basic leucine zipper 4-like isoform X1 [Cucurbita moschata]